MAHPITQARALFALPDYRRTWAIGGLGGTARWLEFVAVAIFAYELTRSPELVAILTVLRMLPYVLLGVVMGSLADQIDRRKLMTGGVAMMAATAAAMTLLTGFGSAGYLALAAASMMAGLFWTFDMPVRRRLMLDAVPRGSIASALGFDNATMYATRAVGPLLGGATYELLGITGIYALIFGCYLAGMALAWGLSGGPAQSDATPTPAGLTLRNILPPAVLMRDRRFLIVLGTTLVFNLWCFPFITMVPVIAQKDFALSPTLVGALSACDGIGGTFGALLIGALASERTLFRFYFLGTLAFLTLVLALALHLTLASAIGVLLALGVAAAAFSATQYALVYVRSPPELRGRATGVLSICIGSSMFGHYHAGLLFERLGSATAMTIMALEGLAVLLVLGVLWWRTPPHPSPA